LVVTDENEPSQKIVPICESGHSKKIAAVTTLQAMIRSWICKRELFNLHAAVLRKHKSAIIIQTVTRSWHCRREFLKGKEEQDRHEREANAASLIQATIRSWKCRRAFSRRKAQVCELEEQRQISAITKIQAMVRCWSCERQVSHARAYAVRIQRCYRNFHLINSIEASELRLSYELGMIHQRAAATAIQAVVRSRISQRDLLVRKEEGLHIHLLQRTTAAITIQAVFRSWSCQCEVTRRKEQAWNVEQSKKVAAATSIQSMVRSLEYERRLIQREAVAYQLESRKKISAATAIQAVVRSRKCKQELKGKSDEACHAKVMQELVVADENEPSQKIVPICESGHSTIVSPKHKSAIIIQTVSRSWQFRRKFIKGKEHKISKRQLVYRRNKFCSDQITANVEIVNAHEEFVPKSKTPLLLIQRWLRGFLIRNSLRRATKAARVIQARWFRYITVLRVKLVQAFQSPFNLDDHTQYFSIISPRMNVARIFLPRETTGLKRIRDITPKLPHHHECGVFIEEMLNSVVVVIQSAARRYVARQKLLTLIYQNSLKDTTLPLLTRNKAADRKNEDIKINSQKQASLRLATDDEIENFILAQIYQNAQSNVDTLSSCVYHYVKKFRLVTEQDVAV